MQHRRHSNVRDHANSGGLRTSPLPSAVIDGAGNVYVVWQDCRFRKELLFYDIVLSAAGPAGAACSRPAAYDRG